MTNKKSLKSALLLSGVSLLLSGAMLVGTTFAWFHDTATSAENTITAGTLDVDLEYNQSGNLESGTWESAANKSIFKTEDTQKWEPGKMVFSYPIRIANKGTKALKYTISVNVAETEDSKPLSDVVQYKVIDYPADDLSAVSDRATAWKGYAEAEKSTGTLNKTENSAALAVVLYWQPDVQNDNDYNFNDGEEHSFKFTVDVYAQQASSEKDTFGNEYDSDVGTVPTVKPAGPAAANEKSEEVYHAVGTSVDHVNDLSTVLGARETIDLSSAELPPNLSQYKDQFKSILPPGKPEGTVSISALSYDEEANQYEADVSFDKANQQMTVSGICGVVGLIHNAVVKQKEAIQSVSIGGTVVSAEQLASLEAINDTSSDNPEAFVASVLMQVMTEGLPLALGSSSGEPIVGPAWLLVPLATWATPLMGYNVEPDKVNMNVLLNIIQGNIGALDGHACEIVITDEEGNAVKYSLMFNVTPKA